VAQLYLRQLLGGRDFGRGDSMAAGMQNFVYLVGDRDTRECMVVDPAWDIAGIVEAAERDDMRITGALVTHYHPDHVGGSMFGFDIEGLAELGARCSCKAHVHQAEAEGVRAVTGLAKSDLVEHVSGDKVKVGGVEIELLHTPGHTPGSQCFLVQDRLVSGDTLFLQGCGRTDFPGGDARQLYLSLTQKLAQVPDSATLFPGHLYDELRRPSGSLGETRRSNFVFKPQSEREWLQMFGG
jgi:glyoxylase-like metal-dependent hydrolase (beta-lactamase superfamily II)